MGANMNNTSTTMPGTTTTIEGSGETTTATTTPSSISSSSKPIATWKIRAARFRAKRETSDSRSSSEDRQNTKELPPAVAETATTTTTTTVTTPKKKFASSLRNLLPKDNNKKEVTICGEEQVVGNPSNPQSPTIMDQASVTKPACDLYAWQYEDERERSLEMMTRKSQSKERDGFCRRVDIYDGQVLTVEGKPAYELGNYLGGGVAGVVYECNRLLPSSEYPVRQGVVVDDAPIKMVIPQPRPSSFICGDTSTVDFEVQRSEVSRTSVASSVYTVEEENSQTMDQHEKMAMDVAIETTQESSAVFIDKADAPSRSAHAAKAAASASNWFMEETVAIKILNPVGFRILGPESLMDAVVIKEGDPMSQEIVQGKIPMQDRHVWWLVNPSSRNLQTLLRYNIKREEGNLKKSRDVDRGTPDRGLRLSLVAAFMDTNGQLRELPLTRCIEIWGHVTFNATDMEFEEMIDAIERVNAGQTPHTRSSPPSRVPTSDSSGSMSSPTNSQLTEGIPITTAKTGLYKAAESSRATVFSEVLNAFIALPAVPPKYLRWLRQRRAATKEIRNMMLIGRHHNVVHLYEVLEYIQDCKSTMFLILELVRGGELFDLISNNSNGGKKGIDIESEMDMRKFFRELASGIHYCHANGIAHRDLKPENLLVHTGLNDSESTLKIADFGLSSTFALNDDDTVRDSVASPTISPFNSPMKGELRGDVSIGTLPTIETDGRPTRSSSISSSFSAIGQQAMNLLTCGNVEDVNWCAPNESGTLVTSFPAPLKRMTSVVGSPHYVAPEIIMQTTDDGRKKKNPIGYDGTKADVWSAGVILYAMLYRSLPFGEDLLRCPRYQSFRKWYDNARKEGGRRSSAIASLNPVITLDEEAAMLGPHWFFPSHTSAESRDLIVAMLNPNPNERLSIEFVLQHPWLTKSSITRPSTSR